LTVDDQAIPALLCHRRKHPTILRLLEPSGDLRPAIVERLAYIDRILRGAKPSELLMQERTKYELAINLKPIIP